MQTSEFKEKPLNKAEVRWLWWFGAASLAVHFSFAIRETMFGPIHVYIAHNMQEDPANMSFMWTVGGLAWMLASIVSSALFKRLIRGPRLKVI